MTPEITNAINALQSAYKEAIIGKTEDEIKIMTFDLMQDIDVNFTHERIDAKIRTLEAKKEKFAK